MNRTEMDQLIAKAVKKMIVYCDGNREDINHFLKVHNYARTLGILEGLDEKALFTLELTAITHDIACPVCRKKYGNTLGHNQEIESEALLRPFFADFNLPADVLERIVFLVTHHHTYTKVDGVDYQCMLEADYLVNCDESKKWRVDYQAFKANVFKTESGKFLLNSMFPELRDPSGVTEQMLENVNK